MSYNFLILLFFVTLATVIFTQNTVVGSIVTDANTRHPLSPVTVAFTGSSINITTDNHANFSLTPVKRHTFKFIRKRFNYSDNPGVSGWEISTGVDYNF